MPYIRVDTSCTIVDGFDVVFTAPCNCNEADGLKVYYPGGFKEFAFRDAHGNVLTGIGELFIKGALVKTVLDVTNGFAYIQNADTNAYLEERLKTDKSLSVDGKSADAKVTGEALLARAEGRSSNYRLSSPGWKRIFVGIRGHSGTIHLSLGCNNDLGHMVQNIALGYSLYADWPSSKLPNMKGQGTYPGGGPRVWQITNHCFGEDPAQVDLSQVYRIDKVRVAFPVSYDTEATDPTGQYANPVNCYVDVHIAGNVRLHNGTALVQLQTNILGKSDNHNTYAVIEETAAPVDENGNVLGALGEKCQTVEFILHEDTGYSIDESSRLKELFTEKTYQLVEKQLISQHFIDEDFYDVKKLTLPINGQDAYFSKVGIRASRKANIVPGAMYKTDKAGSVKVEQVGSGFFRLTGTATNNGIAVIYKYAKGDVPIVLKKGVKYYASGIQLYYNTPETAGLDQESAEFKAGRQTASGYTDGTCMESYAKPFVPEMDMYVTRISVYVNKGNVYDGHLYYPQLTTDYNSIVRDLQTGAINTEYINYAIEQKALGKTALPYVTWLDRELGTDRYSPQPLWIEKTGNKLHMQSASLNFDESCILYRNWVDDGLLSHHDTKIALYRREIIKAHSLTLYYDGVVDPSGDEISTNGSFTIEGIVKSRVPTIYSGSSEPDNSLGEDGDIYIKFEE